MTLIPKDQIMEMLVARGQEAHLSDAANELPDPVDTEEHAAALAELGVSEADLAHGQDAGLKFGLADT